MTTHDATDDYEPVPGPRKGFTLTVRKPGGATLSADAVRFLGATSIRWLARKDGSGFAIEAFAGDEAYAVTNGRHVNYPPGMFTPVGGPLRFTLVPAGERLTGRFPS